MMRKVIESPSSRSTMSFANSRAGRRCPTNGEGMNTSSVVFIDNFAHRMFQCIYLYIVVNVRSGFAGRQLCEHMRLSAIVIIYSSGGPI